MQQKKSTILGKFLFAEAIPSTGMRMCDFAQRMGISRTHLYDIIRGERRLTAKVARHLGDLTNTTARQWLLMQMDEDLRKRS